MLGIFAILAGFLIILLFCIVVFEYFNEHRKLRRYPDFNRVLTKAEEEFIASSQNELKQFAENGSYHSKWNWVINLIYLPAAMIFVWMIAYFIHIIAYSISDKFAFESAQLGEHLWTEPSQIGFSSFIGLFGGIMVAGWICYFATRNLSNFTNWMVLTQAHKEDAASILLRRLNQIEDDVRTRYLDVSVPFNSSHFLSSIARRHRHTIGIVSLGVTLLGFASLFIEVNARAYFYESGIRYSRFYQVSYNFVTYEDLGEVRVTCNQHTRGSNRSIKFVSNKGDNVTSLEMIYRDIDELLAIDALMRERKIGFVKDGPNFENTCALNVIRLNNGFAKVMHLDELVSAK